MSDIEEKYRAAMGIDPEYQALGNESLMDVPDATEQPEDRYRRAMFSQPKEGDVTYLPPKTWFGEATAGFSRGVDQLQQTLYGAGALAADAVGLETPRDYFIGKVAEQERDIAKRPGSITSYDDVHGLNDAARYFLGGLGEVAPNILESVATGAVGAIAGSAAGPEGTAAGGISGFVGRKAARELIELGVEKMVKGEAASIVKKELADYAAGGITSKMLSQESLALLKQQSRRIAGEVGSNIGLAGSVWAQETGGIYNDLAGNPNVTESDRKFASIFGGLVAAVPDVALDAHIVSKFFKGAPASVEEITEAKHYLKRFIKNYGKEIMKIAPWEGGTELAQTFVEEAAKNWADPAKRDAIFQMDEQQKKSFIDASFKGAFGGLLGGGVAAFAETRMPPHPNPKVRTNQADVMEKVEDLSPPIKAEVGPDDIRLGEIGKERARVESELQAPDIIPEQKAKLTERMVELDKMEQEIHARAAEALVTENAPTEPAPEDKKETPETTPKTDVTSVNEPEEAPTPLRRMVAHLRAFYAQQMPNREVSERLHEVDKTAVAQKRAELESLVNEAVQDHPDQKEADAYRKAIMSMDDNTLNFLARENIDFRIPSKTMQEQKGVGFAVNYHGPGNKVAMFIPPIERAKQSSKNMSDFQTAARSHTSALQATAETLRHETVHAADYVGIRRDWEKTDKSTPLRQYHRAISIERGQAIKGVYALAPQLLHNVYNVAEHGEMSDEALGDEFPRMMVELIRTGKIEEFSQALVEAKEQQKQKDNPVSDFLRLWIEGLKRIRDVLIRFMDPATAPPEILQAFHSINKVLDEYGIMVPRKPGPIKPPVKPAIVPPKIVPPKIVPPRAPREPAEKEGITIKDYIEKAKKGIIPIETAMLRHIFNQDISTPESLKEAAKDFQKLYGKGAYLKTYVDLALVTENNKQAAKAGGKTKTTADEEDDLTGDRTPAASNFERALTILGEKMYNRNLGEIVGKEVYQNSIDNIMKMALTAEPGYVPSMWYDHDLSDNKNKLFMTSDNGTGMDLDTILDVFLPAFRTGKKVGAGGGYGVAKLAFLGGPKAWRIVTISEKNGKQTRITLTGSGEAYMKYAGQEKPAKINVKYDTDIELHPGIKLKVEKVSGHRTGTASEFNLGDADASNASHFIYFAKKYVDGAAFGQLRTKQDYHDDELNAADTLGYRETMAVPNESPLGVLFSVSTPEADIDFVAPLGALMEKTSYFKVPILNRSIMQFKSTFNMDEQILLPEDIAVNIKAKVLPEEKGYPFAIDRQSITPQIEATVKNYFAEAGGKAKDQMIARYQNAIKDAPPIIATPGAVLLDAGGSVPVETIQAVANDPMTAQVYKDVARIQNSLLKMLQKKYGGGYGRATLAGFLTGGKAYGVHFGKQDGKSESTIYHDPWLTMKMAYRELVKLDVIAQNEKNEAQGLAPVVQPWEVEGIEYGDTPVPDSIKIEYMRLYDHFLRKTAGIAFHEALHQEISDEGEELARGLTFKAGEIIDVLMGIITNERSEQDTTAISTFLLDTGEELGKHVNEKEAVSFNAAQGYSGYTLSEKGPVPKGPTGDSGTTKGQRIAGPALVNEDGTKYLGKIGQEHRALMLDSAMEGQDFTDAKYMFHDNEGNLLTREEAYQLALEAGQLNEAGLRKQDQVNPKLESQDLLVTENEDKAPAQAGGMSKRDEKIIKTSVKESNDYNNQLIAEIEIKPSERKRVQGEIPLEGASPQQLYYYTRTHTASAVKAQEHVNKVGDAFKMAEILEKDALGESLGIVENLRGEWGPNSILKAVYENVVMQLAAIKMRVKAQEGSTELTGRLTELGLKLEERMRLMGTDAGSYNAYTGMTDNLITGESARMKYVVTIMENGDKIVGKNSRAEFKSVTEELNNLFKKHLPNALNHPKVIALIRRLEKMLDEKRMGQEYRKTLANNLQKLRYVVQKAAARAADRLANDDQSDAYINAAIKRVVSLMTGKPKVPEAATEHQLVLKVLNRMAKGVGREMGLIPESIPKKQPSAHEQMAAILKNEELYNQFARDLYEAYIIEFGGRNPQANQAINDRADELYANMTAKMWNKDIVKELVNEKMEELNLRYSKIVQKEYEKGMYDVAAIRRGIEADMRQEGVEDDALIEQLANDIEEQVQDNIHAAREKFLGSARGIQTVLRTMQTSIGRVALQHASKVDSLKHDFEQALVDEGFPNSPGLMVAKHFADLMHSALNDILNDRIEIKDGKEVLVIGERKKIVERWVAKLANNNPKMAKQSQRDRLIRRILELANTGALASEKAYKALAESYHLPPYSEETAREIQELGDMIGKSQHDRQKDELKQTLANLLTQKTGLKTGDSFISWMYYSMLSGIGTPMVNIGGNATSLMGYFLIEAIKHPNRIPDMLGCLIRTAMGKAAYEFREAFLTGYALGKQGEKWSRMGNPAEIEDPFFKSSSKYESIQKVEEAAANFAHKAIRTMRGQYVGRFLAATDIWFYKLAEEMAYVARVGSDVASYTNETWVSAQQEAAKEMRLIGRDPDGSTRERQAHTVLSHTILEKLRLHDAQGNLVNERVEAWNEAHSLSSEATFTGEPKYFLGVLAKHIDNFTRDMPIGRMLIPFTRVAANVTNHMLEWTPFGIARYALIEYNEGGNPFKLFDEEGKWKKHNDIALRALLGMGATMVLMAMAGGEDEDKDPFFTIYGDGPRDFNQRRMMQEKGWKPNTIKVGNAYFSYLYTPLAMMLSIAGRHLDDFRDGRVQSPSISNMSMASSAVALMEAVKNQSFLASISDLMAAVDSPDPQAKVSKVFARIATIPIPNLFKQIDRVVYPNLQQGQGFWENWLKEMPLARLTLKPALNTFGHEISRTPGPIPFTPGLDRFVTLEKTDDPVLNLISERGLRVPGISKSTRLGNENMSPEQYYEYVKIAGNRIYERYKSEVPLLRKMKEDDAQDRLEKISLEEKKRARLELMAKYHIVK